MAPRLSEVSGISQQFRYLRESALSPTSQSLRAGTVHKAQHHGDEGDPLNSERSGRHASDGMVAVSALKGTPPGDARPQGDTTAKSNSIDLVALELPRDSKDSAADPVVDSFDVDDVEAAVEVEIALEEKDRIEDAGCTGQLSIPEVMADLKKSLSDEAGKSTEQEHR